MRMPKMRYVDAQLGEEEEVTSFKVFSDALVTLSIIFY